MIFRPITVGDHSSVGQRAVLLAGSEVGNNVTVGADTVLVNCVVDDGGTAFGSPALLFYTTASDKVIVAQVQDAAKDFLEHRLAQRSFPLMPPMRIVNIPPTRAFNKWLDNRKPAPPNCLCSPQQSCCVITITISDAAGTTFTRLSARGCL